MSLNNKTGTGWRWCQITKNHQIIKNCFSLYLFDLISLGSAEVFLSETEIVWPNKVFDFE